MDRNTLVYREVEDEDGNARIKKDISHKHHLTFTQESGNEQGSYLTHRVVPLIGATGSALANITHSVLQEFDSTESLRPVLVDNTSTNTGCDSGLVTKLENLLNRRFHTIGCSLHQNELPFRQVFCAIDGLRKSLYTFSGPLGKLCERDCHGLPQTNFSITKSELKWTDFTEEHRKDFSNDQRLLLEYLQGIAVGKANSQFVLRKIGLLNPSMWLTLAIRLLCDYTRGIYPVHLNIAMTQLVRYIVQVYAVSWFGIKRNGKFEMQPVFIFDMIQRIKLQSPTIQKVALENLKFNAFGLLPENVLYSMICSDNMMVRRLAIKKIL